MKLKIIPNPIKEEYDEITQAVKNNDGYCPCLLEKFESSKCICLEFREQTTEGFCHCGRYEKILVDDNT